MNDDHTNALLEARRRSVTLVLEAFYVERDRARADDDPRSGPLQGGDVISAHAHVTVGDWLTEAVSSGARALADRETIDRPTSVGQHPTDHAHHTMIAALSMIAALEALAAQTDEPKLADRQWVIHSAAREAIESWKEIHDERNGLEYAIASWLGLALGEYLTALESNVEVEPMKIAKRLIWALGWTAGEMAVSEESAHRIGS